MRLLGYRSPVPWAVLVGVVASPAWLSLGFFPPPRGDLDKGEAIALEHRSRDRLRFALTREMSSLPGQGPSLVDAVSFYGLDDDVLPCSVQATDDEDEDIEPLAVTRLARRRRHIGDEVVLCVD